MRLVGRVAIITAAGSGIGRATGFAYQLCDGTPIRQARGPLFGGSRVSAVHEPVGQRVTARTLRLIGGAI